jgi:hypothetical protein
MHPIHAAAGWLPTVIAASLCATATAETLVFPGGTAPVVQLSSAAQASALSRPASLVDTQGRNLTPTYDSAGRLVKLKVGPVLNAFDLTATYGPDGRIARVAFGNGYELRFEYDESGNQTVTDRYGNTLRRSASGLRQFVSGTVIDNNGYLVPTLQRVEALMAAIRPVDGLNAIVSATATP